jgi:hypothetical protein
VRQPVYKSSVGRWRPYRTFLAPLLQELGIADDIDTDRNQRIVPSFRA